jgi:hypothetical protein
MGFDGEVGQKAIGLGEERGDLGWGEGIGEEQVAF